MLLGDSYHLLLGDSLPSLRLFLRARGARRCLHAQWRSHWNFIVIQPLEHRGTPRPSGLVTAKRDAKRESALAVFLFSWAGSSAAALFPRTFSDTGDGLSDEMLMAPSLGYVSGRASTAYGQSPLGTPEKYTALSCEWIFA